MSDHMISLGTHLQARAALEEQVKAGQAAVERVTNIQRSLVVLLANRSRDLAQVEDDLRDLDGHWGEF